MTLSVHNRVPFSPRHRHSLSRAASFLSFIASRLFLGRNTFSWLSPRDPPEEGYPPCILRTLASDADCTYAALCTPSENYASVPHESSAAIERNEGSFSERYDVARVTLRATRVSRFGILRDFIRNKRAYLLKKKKKCFSHHNLISQKYSSVPHTVAIRIIIPPRLKMLCGSKCNAAPAVVDCEFGF